MIAGSVRSSETNRCGDAALYFHHITDLLSSQGRLYRAQKFADTGVNHLDIIMQFLEKGNNMLSLPVGCRQIFINLLKRTLAPGLLF